MKKISELEKAQFCEQMAMILDGGISVGDGLSAILAQVEDTAYQSVLTKICKSVENGNLLSTALDEVGVYDAYMVHMIKVGEQSGYLDRIFKELGVYYHRMDDTKKKVKDALTYPSILITMMLVVIVVMLVKILPMFQGVLRNLGIPLQGFSLAMFAVGKAFAIVSLCVLCVLFVVCMYVGVVLRTSGVSFTRVLQKFFFTKKLSYELSVVQFAYAFSLLLNSGYNQESALEMCSAMCEDDSLKKKIVDLMEKLNHGGDLQNCLLESHIFQEVYNRLLVIGLKSGHFETTMSRIAKAYEEDIDYSIQHTLDMVEPGLVALLSVIVGVLLLSVMLPLTGIMANL